MKKDFDLQPMFSPKSIAIIGASEGKGKISARPLTLLKQSGYKGEIYPVNPKYEEISGYKCYKNIESLPENIDLAIIAIKASEVLPALESLAKRSIKSAVVFSSGFSEIGEEGYDAQRRLTEFIERTGIPVCGPNSLGLYNLKDGVLATFAVVEFEKMDPIAFITQSGAVGTFTYRLMNELGLGYQYSVSTGNEAGVDFFDYVKYFSKQKEIKAIGGYLEGARNFDKMNEAIELCQLNDKPFVLMKVGTSEKGAQAATSHTASLAGNASIYSSYFKKKNVIQVNDEEELIDTLTLFTKAKISPQRGGVALVTTSGGAGIIMTDRCEENEIQLAELTPKTRSKLKDILPAFAAIENPIDVTAQIVYNPDKLLECLDVVLADEQVEVCVLYLQTMDAVASNIIPKLSQISRETNKTFVVCWTAALEKTKELLRNSEICWVPTPSRAIKAVKNFMQYNKQKDLLSKQLHVEPERLTAPVSMDFISGALNEFEGKKKLSQYGISIPKGNLVNRIEDAMKTADLIGYPVVLKAVSKQIAHKSDAGAVKINIQTEDELKLAYEEVLANAKKYDPNVEIQGILVEKMIDNGIEVIIGAVQDPLFGPSIMFGLGGVFVEVLKDVVMRPAPVTKFDAYEMIQSIKGYPLLKGFRGTGPYDIDALAETIVKVSEFCMDQKDWLHELDINPVIVHEEGKGVTALDALIVGK